MSGTKLTLQDHYMAHRLSYWFNLLPQLHKLGNSNAEHHLLDVRTKLNKLQFEYNVEYKLNYINYVFVLVAQ